MTTTAFDTERLEALRATFSGELLGPGDAEYDEARRVHNGLIDRRPALIARCRSAADIAAAIRAATDAGSTSRCAAAATTSPAGRCSTAR